MKTIESRIQLNYFGEIQPMGGPVLYQLIIDGKPLEGKCIDANYRLSPNEEWGAFMEYTNTYKAFGPKTQPLFIHFKEMFYIEGKEIEGFIENFKFISDSKVEYTESPLASNSSRILKCMDLRVSTRNGSLH